MLNTLRHWGIETYLVSGDQPRTVGHVARSLGIPEERVFAEVKPAEKAPQQQHNDDDDDSSSSHHNTCTHTRRRRRWRSCSARATW